ncbi:cytochrome b561 and DOMON domain-containing protein At3g61750 [Nymphaea colorata]|nr:cytochrome b561 and DOMON domain-containing protein At3g61750 [Nymphaea colorata]
MGRCGAASFSHYAGLIGFLLCSAIMVEAQTGNCAWDINTIAPSLNSSGWTCRSVWNSFNLGYTLVQGNILSIILSAQYTSGWVGMGFSKDGMMVGSSAMVGWIDSQNKANIKQFYLGAQSSTQVVADQGNLQFTDFTPSVVPQGTNIYLIFQLNFSAPVTRKNLLFAVGSDTPIQNTLTQHSDKISISLDFSAGTLSASSYPSQLKRSHGILAILGWGVLLPIGVIIARYCKKWDPLWYYLHAAIQCLGFTIGLATVIAGGVLYQKLKVNIPTHRGIGIFVFVLSVLQVTAIFLRPHKDAKIRKYWNWYHHWVGRTALLLAAANIFIGIHVGKPGKSWKIGYGFNLAFLFLAVIFLEVILWIRRFKKSSGSPTPQMHPV